MLDTPAELVNLAGSLRSLFSLPFSLAIADRLQPILNDFNRFTARGRAKSQRRSSIDLRRRSAESRYRPFEVVLN